jgi:hypothetical protein
MAESPDKEPKSATLPNMVKLIYLKSPFFGERITY